ncbi:hypothetical protein A0J61_01738 [Choanephora cucurbitarum]|uniref:Uncharacterized protein n=1 Tax=Choanephora cucurbitarum TaxID=101091 RepID=A0A1C7NMP9_9FUNG|nr:hypothetical protein A0J61_01738 [Choanephora cucurbitarum]
MARETVPHKGCTSATCCSPARLWRTLQAIIQSDDRKELVRFFKDDRQAHIIRVALTSRLSNDAALYPPSQRHKIIRLTSRESMLYLGKSYTDLNSLQFALLVSSESMVITLLKQLRLHASPSQLKQYVNHIWGQGNSSLHLAAFLKRPKVVKLLLALGCSIDSNKRNKLPLECCLGDPAVLASFVVETKPVAVQDVQIISPVQSSLVNTLPIAWTLSLVHSIIRSDKIVQPNQCIPPIQLKKPPDILVTF